MALIWRLSSGPIDVPSGWGWELATNFAHAPFFALLAVLAARAASSRSGETSRTSLLLALGVAVGWGIADELHQSQISGRTASLLDLATDATGAAVALWLLALARNPFLEEGAARRHVAVGAAAVLAAALVATLFG